MTETNITQFSNSFRVASYFDKASKGASLCLWVKTGACCDPENKEALKKRSEAYQKLSIIDLNKIKDLDD